MGFERWKTWFGKGNRNAGKDMDKEFQPPPLPLFVYYEYIKGIMEIPFEFKYPYIKGGYYFGDHRKKDSGDFIVSGMQSRIFGYEKSIESAVVLYRKIVQEGILEFYIGGKRYVEVRLDRIPDCGSQTLLPEIAFKKKGGGEKIVIPSFFYDISVKGKGLLLPRFQHYSVRLRFEKEIPIEYPIYLRVYLLGVAKRNLA